jgi:hypothetical protein
LRDVIIKYEKRDKSRFAGNGHEYHCLDVSMPQLMRSYLRSLWFVLTPASSTLDRLFSVLETRHWITLMIRQSGQMGRLQDTDSRGQSQYTSAGIGMPLKPLQKRINRGIGPVFLFDLFIVIHIFGFELSSVGSPHSRPRRISPRIRD